MPSFSFPVLCMDPHLAVRCLIFSHSWGYPLMGCFTSISERHARRPGANE
uniref:Uncharacterized protein n=1 Tax=Picea glauca TaxID=3330 RepID=A0A101LUX9_PICGL|nr:hypothetical protein ABT39_MTgene2363 [Picea glauca]